MARILLAWELGGDYGHLMRFLTLARELSRRKHEPILVLRELTFVDSVLRDEPYATFQAPYWGAQISGLPPSIGFVETLMRLGFLHPSALAGLCRGWRTLVATLDPKLIVFDYAPTGLLATRGLKVRRVLFGGSFSMPPQTEPMPIYRWWKGEPLARVLASERQVLATVNKVLERFSEPPIPRLANLMDADECMIAGAAELEQYPSRVGGKYWGEVANLDKGVAPPWPQIGSKRVFAYIKPHARDFEKVLSALRALDAAVVVHAPGISERHVRTYTAANLAFSERPVRMEDVRSQCDLAVCSGAGTVSVLIESGKPVFVLPQHLEQMMTAKRVQELGAGLIVDFEKPPPDYGRMMRRLLDEPSFAQAACAVAEKRAADGDDHASRVAKIADRLEELMARAA